MKPKDELRHLQFGAVQNDTVEGAALLLFKVDCHRDSNLMSNLEE